jgi:hypothetical protein
MSERDGSLVTDDEAEGALAGRALAGRALAGMAFQSPSHELLMWTDRRHLDIDVLQ